jgi:YVTN family beta-propeller protein
MGGAMNFRLCRLAAIAVAVLGCFGSVRTLAQNAYITNQGDNTVSVIATATGTVTATIPGFTTPVGVAVSPDQSKVYVANNGSSTVSVISTTTNAVIATIAVGTPPGPVGVAISPNGKTVYVANAGANSVSVISTATNTVTATIGVGSGPFGVAVSADGSTVYVVNAFSNNVSVISTASNTVTATISVGNDPRGVVVTPDGSKVYVTNFFGNTVSVITTANDTVTAVVNGSICAAAIPVGSFPDGLTVSPDGSAVYVANEGNGTAAGTVSVIATESNAVTATIGVGLQPVAFGVFISPEVMSVPASGTTCNGVYSGTFTGNITVMTRQNCTFIDGGTVIGNVTVQPGGHFSSSGTKVQGNLTITGMWSQVKNTQVIGDLSITGVSAGTASASVLGNTRVGSRQIQKIAASPASPTSLLCGTTVLGDLTFYNNGNSVQIGPANPLICAGNTITGNFAANNNTGTVLIFDNVVGQGMSVFKNTGLLDVVGNAIGSYLFCQYNSMLVMGGMNTAKYTLGQCGP